MLTATAIPRHRATPSFRLRQHIAALYAAATALHYSLRLRHYAIIFDYGHADYILMLCY